MRFNVPDEYLHIDEEQPVLVFTKEFFKLYKEELIDFAEWGIKNSISVCILSKEIAGYPLFTFDPKIVLTDSKVRAVICYNMEILDAVKGYQFVDWESLYDAEKIYTRKYLINDKRRKEKNG